MAIFSKHFLKKVYSISKVVRFYQSSCVFCREFSLLPNDRVIEESEHYLLFPTVGCLKPGYCLVIPKEHYRSMALIPPGTQIKELQQFVQSSVNLISNRYNTGVFLSEHGMGSDQCDSGAGCVDHAHLHLMPLPMSQAQILMKRFEAAADIADHVQCSFDQLWQAADGDAYILAGLDATNMSVWTKDLYRFRRQFARVELAKLLGVPEQFNWRAFQFQNHMAKTVQDLKDSQPFNWTIPREFEKSKSRSSRCKQNRALIDAL